MHWSVCRYKYTTQGICTGACIGTSTLHKGKLPIDYLMSEADGSSIDRQNSNCQLCSSNHCELVQLKCFVVDIHAEKPFRTGLW